MNMGMSDNPGVPDNCFVVVPWVTEQEIAGFLCQWGLSEPFPRWLILQRDEHREGCGATKNKGIARAAEAGAEVVVVLDGDCYPSSEAQTLEQLMGLHVAALEPQLVEMFQVVTGPPSRGTPYLGRCVMLPVAASMGFWTEIGDYCAVRQLAFSGVQMTYNRTAVYQKYFALCGMNVAFRPKDWGPWCHFIDVPRFDDIWMGWLWQREAYRRGCCFNLAGPLVCHSRQSNVWRNLKDEVVYLEQSEMLWREIATHPSGDYESLRALLPV